MGIILKFNMKICTEQGFFLVNYIYILGLFVNSSSSFCLNFGEWVFNITKEVSRKGIL